MAASFAAFTKHSALWVLEHFGYTANTAAIKRFVQGGNCAPTIAEAEAGFGAYVNYVGSTFRAVQLHEMYYGGAVYARLLALKTIVDPQQVIWNPQAIGA